MADKSSRQPDNVAGKWYVDASCIICNLCSETAPANFKKSDLGEYDIIFNQPSTPEELALCEESRLGCPVEAIGNDGPEIGVADGSRSNAEEATADSGAGAPGPA